MKPPRPTAVLLAPSREALSGVSTHVNLLLGSGLAREFHLAHFQVGSEGRRETFFGRLARLATGPFALASAIGRLDAAIVHVNTSLNRRAFWRDLAFLAAARLAGAAAIVQVHGGTLEGFAQGRPLRTAAARAMLRWADALVVLSRKQRDAWRALSPGGNVALLPNGIDCRPYRTVERPAPDAARPLRLIYVGRLAVGKGLAESIEGLRLARARGVAARLVIAGGGPEAPALRALAADLGLAREIGFVGAAYGAHKAQLLGQADVLVLASYSEGLPYALLEAMAAGVVPIVTPVGAIPDVVTDGVHGAFVPPRDPGAIAEAIAALAADRTRLAGMSAACRQRVASTYSIERLAEDLADLYTQLCAARAPRFLQRR